MQAVLLAGAAAELQSRTGYDGSGRLGFIDTRTVGGLIWYTFGSPYTLGDHLLIYTAAERKPGVLETWSHSASYAVDGTRRLVGSGKTSGSLNATFTYGYDVFGNRQSDQSQYSYQAGDGCQTPFTSSFGTDNELRARAITVGCVRTEVYWHDRAGNRLVQLDTVSGSYQGPKAIMSYTAKSQLFFSMTRTSTPGTNDYNWHWYDGDGVRVVTQVGSGAGWVPSASPATATGPRSYYVYDGTDIALVLVRSGGSWWVRQRYLTGGVDQQVAGRFEATSSRSARARRSHTAPSGSTSKQGWRLMSLQVTWLVMRTWVLPLEKGGLLAWR